MRRAFALLLLAAAVAASARGQTPEQFAAHAATVELPALDDVVELKDGRWMRASLGFTKVKYDVVRTDSVLNPVVAVVTYTAVMLRAAPVPDKGAAASAPFDLERRDFNDVEMRFTPTATGWQFSSGRTYNSNLKQWFDLRRDEVMREPKQPGRVTLYGTPARAFSVP